MPRARTPESTVVTSRFISSPPLAPLSGVDRANRPLRLRPGTAGHGYACGLVRERPQNELLPYDSPEPRKAVRLQDQEHYDQSTDDHHVQMLHGRRADLESEGVRHTVDDDGQRDDQDYAQIVAEDGAEPADDGNEQD